MENNTCSNGSVGGGLLDVAAVAADVAVGLVNMRRRRGASVQRHCALYLKKNRKIVNHKHSTNFLALLVQFSK